MFNWGDFGDGMIKGLFVGNVGDIYMYSLVVKVDFF